MRTTPQCNSNSTCTTNTFTTHTAGVPPAPSEAHQKTVAQESLPHVTVTKRQPRKTKPIMKDSIAAVGAVPLPCASGNIFTGSTTTTTEAGETAALCDPISHAAARLRSRDAAAARAFFARCHKDARVRDDALIARAHHVLHRRLRREPLRINSPATARAFLSLQLAQREHEVFAVIWIDARNHVIAFEELFVGTLTHSSVYPREVVKRALACNAAAVLLAHNHPSGSCEPSCADKALTKTLQQTLALVDVKVVDHIIVGGIDTLSFAEQGLL